MLPSLTNNKNKEGVDMPKGYSKKDIISLLQQYSKENDGTLNLDIYKRKKYKPSETTIRKKFGSWNEALIEAGLPINREVKKWYTREDLILFLQNISTNGEMISANDYQKQYTSPTIETILSTFGTWNEALLAAGLLENRLILEENEILERLKKYTKQYPHSISSEHYINIKWKPSYHTIIRYFGSWSYALEKIGIHSEVITYSDEDILEELGRCMKIIDPLPLTRTKYEKMSNKPSAITIYRRFETWENAIKLAKEYNKTKTISE